MRLRQLFVAAGVLISGWLFALNWLAAQKATGQPTTPAQESDVAAATQGATAPRETPETNSSDAAETPDAVAEAAAAEAAAAAERAERAAEAAAKAAAYRPPEAPEGLAYARRSAKGPDGQPELIRVQPISDELRTKFGLDPFYKNCVVIDGVPIIGSEHVSDWAYLEAAWSLDGMLDGRDKVKDALVASKVRLGIIAVVQYTMDIPENQRPRMIARGAYNDRRSRGLGGLPLATCAEENVLALNGDPYRRENITLHEFSHTLASAMRRADPDWWERLNGLYRQAMDEELWTRTYAATNVQEYWAECTQSWFDCNTEGRGADIYTGDGVHNGIWNRERLKEYDPRIAEFLTETFGDGEWRYSKPLPGDRPAEELAHLEGLDRDAMPTFNRNNSPRIIAAGNTGRSGRGRGGRFGRGRGRRGAGARGAAGETARRGGTAEEQGARGSGDAGDGANLGGEGSSGSTPSGGRDGAGAGGS